MSKESEVKGAAAAVQGAPQAAGKAMVKKAAVKKAPAAKSVAAQPKPAGKTAPAKKAVPVGKGGSTPDKKPATNAKAAKAPKVAKPAAAKEKVKKPRLVRDSFTMPETEYQALGDVKKAFLKIGMSVKKSELLRAGVALIKGMELAKLKTVIEALPPVKAGRPKKDR